MLAPPPGRGRASPQAPWHFLYFLPEPHQHGSLRPIFSRSLLTRVPCGPGGAVAAPAPSPPPSPGIASEATAPGPAAAPAAAAPAACLIAEGWSGPPPWYSSSPGPAVGSNISSAWAGSTFTST